MKIANDIIYIGVDDREIDLFEGQYVVSEGISYNSYVVKDDKIAVFDSADKAKVDEWMSNLAAALDGAKPDFFVISHMEPDHSAGIEAFAKAYPDATFVGNSKTFDMCAKFFKTELKNKLVVKEGDTLSLGAHELAFYTAPMVHWPEVMVTFDKTAGVLFSADAFGKFGALDAEDDDWACEARRYYFNIVGKYGAQVQALLAKLGGLDVKTICPLHGPVLSDNLAYYIGLYDTWSRYAAETEGTFVAYCSVYGNTAQVAKKMIAELESRGEKVSASDLARCDVAEAVEDAFRYPRMIIAAPTLDGGIFPAAEEFISHIKAKGYRNRKIGFIENGSWAPVSARQMRALLEQQKDVVFADTVITCRSTMPDNIDELCKALADEMLG